MNCLIPIASADGDRPPGAPPKSRRPVIPVAKIAAVSLAALWPALARADSWELAPGGLVTVGTSYTDSRIIWIGIVRLALGLLALFTIIRAIRGYFGYLTHDGSEDLKEMALTDLKDSAKFLVIAVVGAAVTPYAVNVIFNLAAYNGVNLT